MNPAKLRDWLPEILFVAFTTFAGLIAGGRWIDPYGDPGFSWSLAHRLSLGEMLYRDVYLPYGPYSPYLLAGLVRFVGSSTMAVLLWNWIPAVVAGALLLRGARPYLSVLERIACAGLIVGFSVFAPGPGRLIFPYYSGVAHALALSLGAILLLRSGRTAESTTSWLSGLLAGLAFWAKQEVGVAAIAALLAARFVSSRAIFAQGLRAVGGFLLAALPGALIAVTSASVRSLRDENHLWPFDITPPPELHRIYRMVAGMSNVDWPADVRKAAWVLLVHLFLFALAALLLVRERKLLRWMPALVLGGALLVWWLLENFTEPFRAPVALSVAVAFFVALSALLKRDLPERPRLIAIGVFAGLVGSRTLFSPRISGHFEGPAHLASSLTWGVFLCVTTPVLLAPAPKAAAAMRRIAGVFLLVFAWYGAIAGAASLRYPWKRRVATGVGDVYLPPNEVSFFEKLRGELRAGETVLVIPEINAVDVLFGVRSISPLLHLMPGWLDARVERQLIPRFERSPPNVVVIFNRPMPEFGFSRFGDGYGMLLEDWIRRNYQPILSDRGGSIFRRLPSAIATISAHRKKPVDVPRSAGPGSP